MALVLRRSYLKAREHLIPNPKQKMQIPSCLFALLNNRSFGDNKGNNPDFINSTILVENGFNVQELPVVVRKLKNISEMDDGASSEDTKPKVDPANYHLIQAEFKQCVDLRDVFSLLSKCTKITPNIALGAMERIYDLEKEPHALMDLKGNHIHMAKGAILDKLLKVVMKTEDTQTIINILKSISTFMEPYKNQFCDELLFRAIDNKLSIEQLCTFIEFLAENKANPKYIETIDKLWVGFVQKESDIDESNIALMFSILPGLKVSKRIVLSLLEQKLTDLWQKIKVPVMQEILNSFVEEKYLSMQSFALVSRWVHTNIHALDEDSFLDVVSKLTRLKYTDDQIENAVEKYVKLKINKIESHVLIVGILNYCMQFQIRNAQILNSCSEFFVRNARIIPPSFLKLYIYPFGYLSFDPKNSLQFWKTAENVVNYNFYKINIEDLCSIILSYIYLGKYPLKLVSKIFSSEYLSKVNKSEALKSLHLIDTALSLECKDYSGPLLPKDQWYKPVKQDIRIQNIVTKIHSSLVTAAGGAEKLSVDVTIPHFSDKTYLIDVMCHPAGLDTTVNWNRQTSRNENIAILIHLPDHYCSDNEQLVGPQIMRKKHLRILGLKVVSVKYSTISQYYTSYNNNNLQKYLMECIDNAEESF
ncbi:FAST kinase domain-containing protein 3, mitochondrial-like [Ostrinia furnacalis]|uniref:FAST kinase domain-containing protein 3, mitochondrial-like n=1 Tax=Ostrinia furnacalis TaxID=93504 RepID=UPI00103A4CF4|nr:FAST kinase domain-containing protein 3, mitochondrial-like [Ostrinia furnacalis]